MKTSELDHRARPALVGAVTILFALACNSTTSSPNVTADTATAPPPPTTPPSSDTGSATLSDAPPATSGPFSFVWTDFHFELGGTAVLDVRERAVRDLFPDSRPGMHEGQPVTEMFFRLATYELSDDELKGLRTALAAPEFWALGPRFLNDQIEDGSTQTFTVAFGTRKKDVYCYHEWPAPVQPVRAAIRSIQDAHRPERDKAPQADAAVAEELRDAALKAGRAAGRKDG